MADTFGVLGSSFWRSKRVRKLDTLGKLTYVYLHTNPHRNSLGLYSLPVVFAADDMDESPKDVRDSISKIADLGLANYDADESLIRVVNWELKNAPQGPQDAIGRVYMFDRSPQHDFTYAAFLCFMREVLTRAEHNQWKPDMRQKMEELLFRRAETWFFEHPEQFMRGFELAGFRPRTLVFARLWESISYKDNIPSQYPLDTKTLPENKDQRPGTENKDQRPGTPRANGSASPPKKKKTPESNVQADIEALRNKADQADKNGNDDVKKP